MIIDATFHIHSDSQSYDAAKQRRKLSRVQIFQLNSQLAEFDNGNSHICPRGIANELNKLKIITHEIRYELFKCKKW